MDDLALLNLIKSRRSFRRFSDREIEPSDLMELVEAATWAPSGSNQQELRFLVLNKKEDIAVVNLCKRHIVNPQAAILIYAYLGDDYYAKHLTDRHRLQLPFFDAGAAMQNLLLQAHSKGIGACWVNLSPFWHLGAELLFKRFSIGPEYRLMTAVLLGYPAEEVDLATRRHHGKLVRRDARHNYLLDSPKDVITILNMQPLATNVGTRALSVGLRDLIERRFRDAEICAPDEPMAGWGQYNLRRLRHASGKEWQIFSAWADRIVSYYRNRSITSRLQRAIATVLGRGKISKRLLSVINQLRIPHHLAEKHDPFYLGHLPYSSVKTGGGHSVSPVSGRPIVASISAAAKRVARLLNRLTVPVTGQLIPYYNRYRNRLQVIDRSFLVIHNGDGDIADLYANSTLRQLLELLVAKKLGAITVSVNQSVDVIDPVLSVILRNVYSQLDLVVVREPISYRRLVELGVPEEKVLVADDAATTISPSPPSRIKAILRKEGIPTNTVGIAVRGDRKVDLNAWSSLVDTLQQRYHKQVLFISNCLLSDAWVGYELQKRQGIKVLSSQYNYNEYLGIVSRLDAVISDRYHTNVFAIMSSVPDIPIRGNTFKTDGLFELFQYPIPVLDYLSSSNLAEAIQHIDYLYTNYETIKANLSRVAIELRKKAEINVNFDLYSMLAINLASSKNRAYTKKTMEQSRTSSPVEEAQAVP